MLTSITRPAAALLLACTLAACANISHRPATLVPAQGGAAARTLAVQAELRLDTGYQRTLKAGSQWLPVGRIAEGEVLRPQRDVFTIEGGHIHEAWLVLRDGALVGFYLPAERGFSPLAPVALQFN